MLNPVSVILPSAPPQVVGCTTDEPPITGAGVVLMLTVVVSGSDEQESTTAITIYAPDMEDWVLVIEGFCVADVNPEGPVQLYVALLTLLAVRYKMFPVHNGPLLDAAGVAGVGLTTACVDTGAELHPLSVVLT